MSTSSITKPFTLLSSNELEQSLNSLQLKEDTLHKLKSTNTSGYDLSFELDTYLKHIDIQDLHEINLIKRFVHKQITDQLKLEIKLTQNQQLTIQLDNNINILLKEVIEYISKLELFKIDEIFLSPLDSNEMLMPNIKIVRLILEQPTKYSTLKLYDKSTMNNRHSLRYYNNNNKTNLERDVYAVSYSKFSTSNTARNSNALLQDKFNISEIEDNNNYHTKKYDNYGIKHEKEETNNNNTDNVSNNIQPNYYQYSHMLNHKSKSLSNLTSTNQNQPNMVQTNSDNDNISPLPSSDRDPNNKNNNNNNITNLKAKSYTTYNSITEKYRKYGTNNNEKDNNDTNTKDEFNHYIRKGYGFYQPLTSNDKNDLSNDNINNSKNEYEQIRENELPHCNNIEIETSNEGVMLNMNNKDRRKFSSEKRNYRQYEGSRTPDHNNNEIYKRYEKYSSNDNDNKQYALSPNYNQRHQKGNTVTSSLTTTDNTKNANDIVHNGNTGNNISAYELRNKVNSMRNQLNAYASLNPINNKEGDIQKKERNVNSNNFSNYKAFKKENDDSNDNININNLNNINIGPPSSKHSRGYPKQSFKYES